METIESFDTPGLFHEGVLYMDDKPLYIVEYYNESGMETYVSVFDVTEESKADDAPIEAIRNPRKAFERRKEVRGFKNVSPLSKIASERYKSQEHIRELNKPPVFTAPVEFGKDTFHGIEGQGFFERTKDKYIKRRDQIVAEGGQRTGVFIALDTIQWKRHYIPTADVLNQYQARISIWDEYL